MSAIPITTTRPTSGRNQFQEELDEAWVDGIRNGNVESFEKLYYTYTPQLYAFAVKFLNTKEAAWEIVDDVFVKIWRMRSDWQPHGLLRPYLYRAVKNQLYSHLRRKKARRRIFAVDMPTDGATQERTAHDELESNQLCEIIWKFAEEMPERRRMVYYLHRKHGLTYNEIAEVMEITPSTVDNHMGRALKDLRERLERVIV